MGANNHYTAAEFIKEIPGTGGIISTIAARVGCAWNTAQKYIKTYPTIQAAYRNEVEKAKDVAESLVITNIRINYTEQQETKRPVDSSDAKWYLSRKAPERGYRDKSEVELGGGIEIKEPTIFLPEVKED